jgi:hypothetical protein
MFRLLFEVIDWFAVVFGVALGTLVILTLDHLQVGHNLARFLGFLAAYLGAYLAKKMRSE